MFYIQVSFGPQKITVECKLWCQNSYDMYVVCRESLCSKMRMLQHTESDVSRISPNMKMRSSIENFRSEISGGLNNIDNPPNKRGWTDPGCCGHMARYSGSSVLTQGQIFWIWISVVLWNFMSTKKIIVFVNICHRLKNSI